MRNLLFLVLRIIIELTIANAAVNSLTYFAGVPETFKTSVWYYLLIIGLTIVLLFPRLSFSLYLLAYAKEEPEPRGRQWPNIILGITNFLSGLPYMVSWTDPATLSAVFEIPYTPLVQYPIFVMLGGVYVWTGISFLQFLPYAKRLGLISTAVAFCIVVWNCLINRDVWLEQFMARMAAEGQGISLEYAQTMITLGIWFMAVFIVVQLWLIHLSRVRSVPAR